MITRKVNVVKQKIKEQRFHEEIEKCDKESNHDNKINSKKYNAMKVVYLLLLLSLPTTFVCAFILTILRCIKVNNKFSFSVLEIFLYSLIPAALMSFVALMLFIVVKCVDRFHENTNVSKNEDDKVHKNGLQETKEDSQQKIVYKDSEDLFANTETKIILQKTEEDSQQEVLEEKTDEDLQQKVLEEKRQIIRNEALNAIKCDDTVHSTDDDIHIKKDLIKAICCDDADALLALSNKYYFFSPVDDYTRAVMTPFRGVIPLDLAIKLGNCNVVKHLMHCTWSSVISRGGDQGQQFITLTSKYGSPEIQEMVKKKYQFLKKSKHTPNEEGKHIPETDNCLRGVSLDDVSGTNSENKDLSLIL